MAELKSTISVITINYYKIKYISNYYKYKWYKHSNQKIVG